MKALNFASLLLALLWLNPCTLKAEVKPAIIFGDNMVLQQQREALPIWGTASPNKQVKILTSWNNQTYSIQSNRDGKWKATIATPKAGGHYKITFDDGTKTVLSNILIGEVWLCAGQSNMEMPMKGFNGQPLEKEANMDIVCSANQDLRFFTVKRNSTIALQENVSGTWETASPVSTRDFSAAAYYFGRLVQSTLNIPVGLLAVHWGGSSIESWMSREMLADFPDVVPPTAIDPKQAPQRTPTIIYNGMVHPLVGFDVRGAIWYQGESNVEYPSQYIPLFKKFITSLRNEWNIGEFPFYYCQIAPYQYYKVNSALLREAQSMAESQIPNTGMAVLMDAGSKGCIHPSNKQVAGERLALQALVRTYGMEGAAAESPVYRDMSIQNDTVILRFNRVPMGLTAYSKPMKLFTLAGEDQKFYPAKAWIKTDKVYLVSEEVKKPVAARYAFENYAEGELFSVEGLPVSSFRTDQFDK